MPRRHADDNQDDAEADNEGADDGHAPVDAPPPPGAFMKALRVDVDPLVACLHSNIQMACAVGLFCHFSLQLGRNW